MLKTQRRRIDRRIEAAMQRLATIEAISSLANEDLLDIADIFKAEPHTPLAETAFTEMTRRGISL